MQKGWIKDDQNWYYMYDSGAMAKDAYIDGYLLDKNGAWISTDERLDYTLNKCTSKSTDDNLIISTFSSDNKGKIISLDTKTNAEKVLVDNKDVSITGDSNKEGNKVAYADAIGDYDPWQVYLYDTNSHNTSKITNNKFGKANAKISQDNSIYFITSTQQNIVKIGKVKDNVETIIDNSDNDREIDRFNYCIK